MGRTKSNKDSVAPVEAEPLSVTAEVVRCGRLNIRERPDPQAKILGVLSVGEKVVVNLTAKYDKYYEILTKSGQKGYAMKTYLSIIE